MWVTRVEMDNRGDCSNKFAYNSFGTDDWTGEVRPLHVQPRGRPGPRGAAYSPRLNARKIFLYALLIFQNLFLDFCRAGFYF
jgi:hypothetical protein